MRFFLLEFRSLIKSLLTEAGIDPTFLEDDIKHFLSTSSFADGTLNSTKIKEDWKEIVGHLTWLERYLWEKRWLEWPLRTATRDAVAIELGMKMGSIKGAENKAFRKIEKFVLGSHEQFKDLKTIKFAQKMYDAHQPREKVLAYLRSELMDPSWIERIEFLKHPPPPLPEKKKKEVKESKSFLFESVCKICGDDNPYADPNQPDGSFVCATCRARAKIWGGKEKETKAVSKDIDLVDFAINLRDRLHRVFGGTSHPVLERDDGAEFEWRGNPVTNFGSERAALKTLQAFLPPGDFRNYGSHAEWDSDDGRIEGEFEAQYDLSVRIILRQKKS